MTFEPICMRIVDTLQVEMVTIVLTRGYSSIVLRNLHQLGAANFVYIGATHSRFEHCLGVAYLAEKMIKSIRSHQPFSHVFDGLFLDQLRKKNIIDEAFKWSHEQGSVDMFDFLLSQNDISRFLYDIVNNAHSGLDVDKLDYFMRDLLYTGGNMSCDTDLLIRNTRVLADREDPNKLMVICFPEKLVGQIMQAFRTRYELHQSVYQHRGVRAIDYMLCDLLISANDYLTIKGQRISEVMCSMEAYQHFDDRVLLKIQESDGAELSEARSLLNRIFSKPYYDFVGKTALTDHSQQKSVDMLLNEVLRCSARRSLINDIDAVILDFMRVHYGKGKEDPLQHVRFYSKNATASSRCFRLPECAYEMFSPRKFEEYTIRIFVKESHLVAPVREAFEKWCRKYNNSQMFPLFAENAVVH
ncbi:unnamed protein product [Peronospora destructor]|uniref:Uncharacterized protein n=1 Tax=Peronospora destructor TaxID=86335 RepID=A0AAV0UFE4_9STRA|nr:unnamed protein product [Peronospora destructor]